MTNTFEVFTITFIAFIVALFVFLVINIVRDITKEIIIKCGFCGKQFKSYRRYCFHVKMNHLKELKKYKKEK